CRVPITRILAQTNLVIEPPVLQFVSAARRQWPLHEPPVAVFLDRPFGHHSEGRIRAKIEKKWRWPDQFDMQRMAVNCLETELSGIVSFLVLARSTDIEHVAGVGGARLWIQHAGP